MGSNNDSDGKENVKKLAKQQRFTCVALFFYISFPSLDDFDVKLRNFTFC